MNDWNNWSLYVTVFWIVLNCFETLGLPNHIAMFSLWQCVEFRTPHSSELGCPQIELVIIWGEILRLEGIHFHGWLNRIPIAQGYLVPVGIDLKREKNNETSRNL